MISQGEARRKAKELSGETGLIHIATTVRPVTSGGWIVGGWDDNTSRWVVVCCGLPHSQNPADVTKGVIVYPNPEDIR